MEITAVDQGDVEFFMAQRSSGIEPTEATADDYDPMHLTYIDAFTPEEGSLLIESLQRSAERIRWCRPT